MKIVRKTISNFVIIILISPWPNPSHPIKLTFSFSPSDFFLQFHAVGSWSTRWSIERALPDVLFEADWRGITNALYRHGNVSPWNQQRRGRQKGVIEERVTDKHLEKD